jgi:hypothetical protein
MIRLAMILYSLIASSLAGTGVIVLLTLGHVTLLPILVAATAGALLAAPISWLVARRLYGLGGG